MTAFRVEGLDHVNIRTRDVAASADFYAELLGLRVSQPPGPATRSRWLLDHGGRAIIHLRALDCEPGPTGAIDHIALKCAGKDEIIRRLKARGMAYGVYEGLADGLCQIFLRDPHGVAVELSITGE